MVLTFKRIIKNQILILKINQDKVLGRSILAQRTVSTLLDILKISIYISSFFIRALASSFKFSFECKFKDGPVCIQLDWSLVNMG